MKPQPSRLGKVAAALDLLPDDTLLRLLSKRFDATGFVGVRRATRGRKDLMIRWSGDTNDCLQALNALAGSVHDDGVATSRLRGGRSDDESA